MKTNPVMIATASLLFLAACSGARASAPTEPAAASTPAPTVSVTPNEDGSLTLTNPLLGFEMLLPAGAQENPAAVNGTVIHSYVLGVPPAEFVVISVQRLGETIDRSEPGPGDLPPEVSIAHYQWKEHRILGLRMALETEAGPFVDHMAHIPLSSEAIALHVAGPAGFEEEFEGLLPALLTRLEGSSNW